MTAALGAHLDVAGRARHEQWTLIQLLAALAAAVADQRRLESGGCLLLFQELADSVWVAPLTRLRVTDCPDRNRLGLAWI